MSVNYSSRYYELLPDLPIEVVGNTPAAFRQKVECELGLYYRDAGSLKEQPVLVIDGAPERTTVDDALELDTIDLVCGAQEVSIILKLERGSVLIRGLSTSDQVRFSCQGNISVRDAWYYLENIYKHLCLVKRKTMFIHGCSFKIDKRHFLLSGWSGSGKTLILLAALKRGGIFFAEDFFMLSETGMIYPYVPVYFDMGYYHILKTGLLSRLSMAEQLKCLLVAVLNPLVSRCLPGALRKIGLRIVRSLKYYYLNWQDILEAEYDNGIGLVQDGQWYILKNAENDLSSTILSSQSALMSLAAATLCEMAKYLDMLWQAEFLGLNLEAYCTKKLIQGVFATLATALHYTQVQEIKLPKTPDPNIFLDRIL